MILMFENGASADAVASRHGRSAKAVMLRLGSILEKGHGGRLRNVSDAILTRAKEMLASEASAASPSGGQGRDQHVLIKILGVLEEIRDDVHKLRAYLKKK